MDEINSPAFPYEEGLYCGEGMSLRDYFAGQLISGLVAKGVSCFACKAHAKGAYLMAEALLEERLNVKERQE